MLRNRWPVTVKINTPRKNGSFSYWDKARREIRGSKEQYKLKKNKDTIKPSLFEHLERTDRGEFLELWSPQKGIYHPMGIDKKSLIPRDKDDVPVPRKKILYDPTAKAWANKVLASAWQRLTPYSKWERNAPFIFMFIGLLGVAIAFYIMFQGVGDLGTSLAQAAEINLRAAEALGRTAETIGQVTNGAGNTPLPPY